MSARTDLLDPAHALALHQNRDSRPQRRGQMCFNNFWHSGKDAVGHRLDARRGPLANRGGVITFARMLTPRHTTHRENNRDQSLHRSEKEWFLHPGIAPFWDIRFKAMQERTCGDFES
jgi:hypothetical protein